MGSKVVIERHTKIVNIVNNTKKIDVNKLSEILGISPVTVRKDLDYLESKNLLIREHGYALKCNGDDISHRLASKYETKMKIAQAATDLVSKGETVIIESGSSCALLASVLAQSQKDVTIITNSAFIASYVRETGSAKIILLGGEYQKESQVMVGPLLKICATEFHVDKFFLGTDGFDPDFGFTASDLMRTEAVKVLAGCARHIYVLTDSSKFKQKGITKLIPFDQITGVITDCHVPDEAIEKMNRYAINLIITEK